MRKHLVIVGFDEIVADKYMSSIYEAISRDHIDGYSIVDLTSQKDWIEQRLKKIEIQPEFKYYLGRPVGKDVWADKNDFEPIFKELKEKKGEIKVYIAAELKAHEEYLQYCIENYIDTLTEKPVFAPIEDGRFDPVAIDKKMEYLLSIIRESPAKHSVTTLARYHYIYNGKVIDQVRERVLKYNSPLTSLHLRFAAGVWNTHIEYEKREDHPYKYGYGMLMHGAYHYIDIIMQLLSLNILFFPNDNLQLTLSSYGAFPADQNDRISKKYSSAFDDNRPDWANIGKNKTDYGETDITSVFQLSNKTTGRVITLGTMSFEQTTPSIRTWKDIPDGLYNKNGRTASLDLEAQLSTLFALNVKCFDVPDIEKGGIDAIGAFARIETRANALLLPDEKFNFTEEVSGVTHNVSNRALLSDWLAGVEKKSLLKDHIVVMKILQTLAESIKTPGYPITFNFSDYVQRCGSESGE